MKDQVERLKYIEILVGLQSILQYLYSKLDYETELPFSITIYRFIDRVIVYFKLHIFF